MATIDTVRASSSSDYSNLLVNTVDLTNLIQNGAKFFKNPDDRNRFIEEFGRSIQQNPHWTPIKLIRERLQLQMKIQNDRMLKRGRDRRKNQENVMEVTGVRPQRRRKRNRLSSNSQDSNDERDEDYSLEPCYPTSNDRLIETINSRIRDNNTIELDKSNTIFAEPDNVLVINAGDGKYAVLDCRELLELRKDKLIRGEDLKFTEPPH